MGGKCRGQGLPALLSEFMAVDADEIQMDLKINSALLPLPFTSGDELFFFSFSFSQGIKTTLAEEMCTSLCK